MFHDGEQKCETVRWMQECGWVALIACDHIVVVVGELCWIVGQMLEAAILETPLGRSPALACVDGDGDDDGDGDGDDEKEDNDNDNDDAIHI